MVRVAEHIAKTMISIGSNIDEREINLQLDELKKLVNEATANPNG
jgi:7,8-dihydro-6-hydroxymethylpterin-pyrophosphokinase